MKEVIKEIEEIEYGISYSGGSMLVSPNDPELEIIYPKNTWIKHCQLNGQKVYRRVVVVREDWQEVSTEDQGS